MPVNRRSNLCCCYPLDCTMHVPSQRLVISSQRHELSVKCFCCEGHWSRAGLIRQGTRSSFQEIRNVCGRWSCKPSILMEKHSSLHMNTDDNWSYVTVLGRLYSLLWDSTTMEGYWWKSHFWILRPSTFDVSLPADWKQLPMQVKDLNIEEGGAFTVSSADELLSSVPWWWIRVAAAVLLLLLASWPNVRRILQPKYVCHNSILCDKSAMEFQITKKSISWHETIWPEILDSTPQHDCLKLEEAMTV